ncbi:hypothetical protein QVD17_21010 [Tagetes erecta]|uniref:protein-serine/threonine phosphatase n=1 Tax=Tagetes erecta TaxID=13708 RepID=A0AAD8NRI6_TARER|nr:hypothetical protein QVD17_21010 [Tagetes erecta]
MFTCLNVISYNILRWRLSFKMSSVDDSLLNSSSIDDFAAYLDSELESTSDTSPEPEEYANEMRCLDTNRIRKRKLEVLEGVVEANGSTSQHETIKTLEASAKEYTCTHPGFIGRMCIKCGEEMVNQSGGIAFGYIHEGLWLANDEIVRLRKRNLKSLFNRKKLCLVLDLDHTLLNSTPFSHITQEEGYLMNKSDPVQGLAC